MRLPCQLQDCATMASFMRWGETLCCAGLEVRSNFDCSTSQRCTRVDLLDCVSLAGRLPWRSFCWLGLLTDSVLTAVERARGEQVLALDANNVSSIVQH